MPLSFLKGALAGLLVAYIMPTAGVLKRFANARDELTVSGVRAEGVGVVSPVLAKDVAALLGTTWNSGELNLNATLAVRFPGRCRLELSSPDSTKTLAATWANGKKQPSQLAALDVALEQACALLSQRSGQEGATREVLSRHLAALKVDQRQTSLARFAGSVSYLIGAKADGQPSLWVFKESFLPSRLKLVDETGAAWDVRFTDYTSQATGEVWPRVIEVLKGNEPQLRVMLLRADLKADLSAEKF
ncbi:MAG: hypothetical protein ACOZQL_00475 [Myxococcota bacterium]